MRRAGAACARPLLATLAGSGDFWFLARRNSGGDVRAGSSHSVSALAVLLAFGLAGCDRPGPLAAAGKPPPAPPAWAVALNGRALAATFPGRETCVASVDAQGAHYQGARQLEGWAWNVSAGRAVDRFAVVDDQGRMVGFGEGGGARPDVPAARPDVRSANTGWQVIAPYGGRLIYGLDPARRAACRIGVFAPQGVF